MATQKLSIAQYNTAPPLGLTATRAGVAIDITGATVAVIIAKGATVVNAGHQAGTIVLGTAGTLTYTPQTGDFITPGTYKAELKITYANGSIETVYDQIQIKVRKTLQ